MAITNTSNAAEFPDVLIDTAHLRSNAIYADVNPIPEPHFPEILYDAAAVMGALRNLFLCPRGGRSRIFQPEYFSNLFGMLQEPFDDVTSSMIQVGLYQSISRWEPRLQLSPSDIVVLRDTSLPGYTVQVTVNVNGQHSIAQFNLPKS